MLPSTQSRLRSAASVAIGTTCTVRDPVPSGVGPTVMSTILPDVFSNRLYTLAGGRSGWPFTGSRYSPAFTLTPGSVSGARRLGLQVNPPETLFNPYRPVS